MKILVVSGFLGAGKTTFIKTLANRTNLKFVVMENEYSSIDVDGDVLAQNEKINIWELTEGCICCSVKNDFAASVLTIANTLDPEYLVVEPTGVGMLSNIIANLQQISYERISVLAPVTIVDVHNVQRGISEYRDLFCDQIKCAGQVIISKADTVAAGDSEKLQAAMDTIRKINADSRIVAGDYSRESDEFFMDIFHTGLDGTVEKVTETATDFDRMGIQNARLSAPEEFFVLLEELIRGRYGQIERAKGVVSAGEVDLRFDVVGERYSVIEAEAGADNKCVFIGQALQRTRLIEKLLAVEYQGRIPLRENARTKDGVRRGGSPSCKRVLSMSGGSR